MFSLSYYYQAGVIKAFNSILRYLNDLFKIDYPYFEQLVGQIYPTKFKLNKENSFFVLGLIHNECYSFI